MLLGTEAALCSYSSAPLGARFVGPPSPGSPLSWVAAHDLRNEPSPKGRSSFRVWQDGEIPPALLADSMGGCLGPRDQRKLGKSAVTLWRWLLDQRGYGDAWFRVQVAAAGRSTGLPLRTAERALARLRAAGLVLADVRRQRRQTLAVLDAVANDSPTLVSGRGWLSTLWLRVFGAVDYVRREELLWVPTATLTWCDQAPGRGGNRRGRTDQTGGSHAWAPTTPQGVTDQTGGPLSILDNSKSFYLATAKQKDLSAPADTASSVGRKTQMRLVMPISPSTTRRGLLPVLLRTEDAPDLRVRKLVEAYNAGLTEVFGPKSKGRVYLGGKMDIRRQRYHAKLLAAAELVVEHQIPPSAWAVWCLRGGLEADTRRGVTKPTPRPLTAVWSTTTLLKRRGWFRKTTEHSYGHTANADRTQLEQLYRNREVNALDRGSDPTAALMFLPKWYATLRLQEHAAGIYDPLDCYPGRSRKAVTQ